MTDRPELSDAEMDALLARAAGRIVTPPHLLDAVERRIDSERRPPRSRHGALLALAAAIALLITGWLVVFGLTGGPTGDRADRGGDVPQMTVAPSAVDEDSVNTHIAKADPAGSETASQVETRIDFPDESNLFARHIESTSSDVSIYFIYRSAGTIVAESGVDIDPATPRSDDT